MSQIELIAIMPVYDEEAGIAGVVTEWLQALSREQISHYVIAINDGSTDASLSILNDLQSRNPERLLVLSKENSGHGRACRLGYERALEEGAPWILQIDSDGQCDPGFLSQFLAKRIHADCVFGVRVTRGDGQLRRVVSKICRLLVAIVTAQHLKDPNVPYRLIERTALEKALQLVPKEFDLQNIALTVALARNPTLRWAYVPIRFRAPEHSQKRMGLSKIVRMGYRMLTGIHKIRAAELGDN